MGSTRDQNPSVLCQQVLVTPYVGLCLLACSLIALILVEDTLPSAGTWKSLATAPTKRTEVAAAAVGGKIYVVGGFSKPSWLQSIVNRLLNRFDLVVTDVVEEYDPATNRWTEKAPLPIPLHHTSAARVGNRLYVIGGFTPSLPHHSKRVFVYDPSVNSWSERAPMPTPRGALATAEFNGKLFAIGGMGDKGNSAAVEMYDPVKDTWTSRAPIPTPRDHLATAAAGKLIYAIGGRLKGDYSQNLSTVEAYDPITDRWVSMTGLATPRSGIAAGVIRDIIYVVGGENPSTTYSTNEAYSPEANRWQVMAPMPSARHGLGVSVVNGRLYVLSGGPTPGASYTNVNEMFIPPE